MTEIEANQILDEVTHESPKLCERLYRALLPQLSKSLAQDPEWGEALVTNLVAEVVSEAHKDGKTSDVTRTKRAVLDALRRLHGRRFGRLLLGRRGSKTRFVVWPTYTSHAAFLTALRERISQRKHSSSGSYARGMLLQHTFSLRSGFTVKMELPEDFSRPEALRLARFVRTLPFDGGA